MKTVLQLTLSICSVDVTPLFLTVMPRQGPHYTLITLGSYTEQDIS